MQEGETHENSTSALHVMHFPNTFWPAASSNNSLSTLLAMSCQSCRYPSDIGDLAMDIL